MKEALVQLVLDERVGIAADQPALLIDIAALRRDDLIARVHWAGCATGLITRDILRPCARGVLLPVGVGRVGLASAIATRRGLFALPEAVEAAGLDSGSPGNRAPRTILGGRWCALEQKRDRQCGYGRCRG